MSRHRVGDLVPTRRSDPYYVYITAVDPMTRRATGVGLTPEEAAKIHRPKIRVVRRGERDVQWWIIHKPHGDRRGAKFLITCPKCPDMCTHMYSIDYAMRVAIKHVQSRSKSITRSRG